MTRQQAASAGILPIISGRFRSPPTASLTSCRRCCVTPRNGRASRTALRPFANLPTSRDHKRWKWELHWYWVVLEDCFDPVEVYQQSLSAVEQNTAPERFAYLLNEVAGFHRDAGRYAGAEPLLRRALEGFERVLGKEHPDTLTSVNNLARLLDSTGDYAGAEPLYRRALEGIERVLGKEHPDTLTSVDSLAELLYSKGDYASAEPLYRRALEASERVLGKEHPDTLTA